jgi:hypothetical protein
VPPAALCLFLSSGSALLIAILLVAFGAKKVGNGAFGVPAMRRFAPDSVKVRHDQLELRLWWRFLRRCTPDLNSGDRTKTLNSLADCFQLRQIQSGRCFWYKGVGYVLVDHWRPRFVPLLNVRLIDLAYSEDVPVPKPRIWRVPSRPEVISNAQNHVPGLLCRTVEYLWIPQQQSSLSIQKEVSNLRNVCPIQQQPFDVSC